MERKGASLPMARPSARWLENPAPNPKGCQGHQVHPRPPSKLVCPGTSQLTGLTFYKGVTSPLVSGTTKEEPLVGRTFVTRSWIGHVCRHGWAGVVCLFLLAMPAK